MHKMVVPYNSNVCENSLVQWNVWIHRLQRENIITMSPVFVGHNFSSVDILLTFTLFQCNAMTLLNNLSGTGASSHVAKQGSQVVPQAPPPPATIVAHGTSTPEEKLLKVSPKEPPPALPSTTDHAPSHRPSTLHSPPSPFLTLISIHSDTTSERNCETSPPAMSQAAVFPVAISVVAMSSAARSPDVASSAFTSQSTQDYSLGSSVKQDSPDLIPVLAPMSPSIPAPPVPTKVQLPQIC